MVSRACLGAEVAVAEFLRCRKANADSRADQDVFIDMKRCISTASCPRSKISPRMISLCGSGSVKYYDAYMNSLCQKRSCTPDGQYQVVIDQYMIRRLEIKLITAIVTMKY